MTKAHSEEKLENVSRFYLGSCVVFK